MSKTPLVSIILTTFNRREMIEKTLKSILEQNYDTFEVIVVDDASTDETAQFFSKFQNERVTYLRHERNQGVQNASITGFSAAQGKYLAFVGDDDVWTDSERLQKQVGWLESDSEERYGAVTSSIRVVREDTSFVKTIRRPKNIIKHLLFKNGIIYGSAALLRRSAYVEAGGFDPLHVKGTDSDVFRRIVLLGYDIHFFPEPMIDYSEVAMGRMTSINIRNIRRSILGETRKLAKYQLYYSLYNDVNSNMYLKLGQLYQQLNKQRCSKELLNLTNKFYIKSIQANPFNYRAVLNLMKSLLFSLK
jgi:glycosyltransferase involved in cell wall biosynthesis